MTDKLTAIHQNLPGEHRPGQRNAAVAYLVSLGSSKSRQTMKSFLNNVARMTGWKDIHDCDWSQLRRHHVHAVIQIMSTSGKAPATVNTCLSALKGVAQEAWAMQQIDTDSFQHIQQVKSVRGSRLPPGRALDREEFQALFTACEEDTSIRGVRDAAIIAILIGCGLRRSEVVALDYAHILKKDQALKVLGKGNKERVSFMPAGTWRRLIQWIEEIRGDAPGPLFFRIRKLDELTPLRLTDKGVYYILENRRLKCGLRKFTPHDLRRTFAGFMLDNGEDILTVRDAMGHASIATTQKYDRRGAERLKNARNRLEI